ncbi:MAG TPA: MYXO-CTERM sorting domain-containing protein [Polyangiaceae bacterium]|jgi:MYXO-CTERM domain-containing protein
MTVAQSSSITARCALRLPFAAATIAAVCLPALVACSSASSDPDGSLRGELHIYTFDYPDGHAVHDYYLAPNDQTPADTHLHFDKDPPLEPWEKIKVWGETQKDGTLNVTRYEEVTDELGVATEPLTNVTPKTQTVGFVMMDIGNGVNIDMPTAQTAIFGTRTPATSAGLNQYYTETSYGGLGFTGQVLGPVTDTSIVTATCQQSAVTAVEKNWPTQFGMTFDHWMTYIGSNDTDCGWSGLGGEGNAARPATGSWYNASTGCTVLAQEVGHNLGLMHSNSLRCTSGTFVDAPQGTCTAAEYGDRHTVMGQACAHFNGYEKWYEGFFAGCNGVRATQSGTYTLLPTELACNGVQVLQIPMPKTRPFANTTGVATVVNLSMYYLELRTKVSIDGKETLAVLVEVGADVPAPNKTSQFTWVLDMNAPTTPTTYDGMTLGQSYTDPAGGVTFVVNELDANHASVQVTLATETPPTCIDGSAFAAPGPATCDGAVVGSGGAAGAGGTTGTGGAAGSGAGGSAAGGVGGTSTGAGGATAGTSGTGTAGTSGTGTAGASGTGAAGASGSGTGGTSTAGTAGTAGASTAGTGTVGTGGTAGSGPAATGGAAGSATGVAGSTSPTAGSTSNERLPNPLPAAKPGCACRAAPGGGSNAPGGWLGLAVLGLGLAVARKRRGALVALAPRRLALGFSFVAGAAGLFGCSSKSDTAASSANGVMSSQADCAAQGETLTPGFTTTSSDGYTFVLTSLDPPEPVISSGAPGNTWKLQIDDNAGAPVAGGGLLVSSFMPAHGHSAPEAVGVDLGGGSYEVDSLILPMPGLYDITLALTPTGGGTQESAALTLCTAITSG